VAEGPRQKIMDATLAVSSAVIMQVAGWLDKHVDLATVVLILLMIGAYRVLRAAQKRKDVDLITILRNSDGKFSYLNAAGVGAFIISAWVLMHDTLSNQETDWKGLLVFLGVWSGAPVINALANKWNGQLPWSKPQ
jgi:hypothetical protein